MSHSTVLVIGPADEEALEEALAPFDEELQVDRYINATKESQIWDRRQKHAYATECHAKYVLGEPPYHEGSAALKNHAHIKWITETMPAEAKLDDEALWEVILKDSYGDEDRDEEGNLWTTYNPRSRWDWYSVGGRWAGEYPLRNGDYGLVEDLYPMLTQDLESTKATFAILDQHGEWHERGKMGWFAMVSDEQEQEVWVKKWKEILSAADQTLPVWLVDVHI